MFSEGHLPVIHVPILATTAAPEFDSYQAGFFLAAIIFIVFTGWRGWQLGVVRQTINILALFTAYLVGYLSGGTMGVLLSRFIDFPERILAMLGSAVLGFVIYFSIILIGSIAFKKTDQQSVTIVRLGYGATGSIVGMLYGVFLVWVAVLGIRVLGSAAQTRLAAEKNPRFVMNSPAPFPTPNGYGSTQNEQGPTPSGRGPAPKTNTASDAMIRGLAHMKKSLEQGATGAVVEQVDPIPGQLYSIMDKIGIMASDEKSLERFLNFPGVKPLIAHPKVAVLQSDPDISKNIASGNYLALIRNPRLNAVANDQEIATMLQKFEFEKALDYAIRRPENDTAKTGRPLAP